MSAKDDDDDLATAAEQPAARAADTMIDAAEATGQATSESQPAVDASPRELGQTLDFGARYQPRRELGRGGMGEVTLCFDTQIGRDVALKVMLERSARHRASRERFVREARVQAQLEHPGVVPVYDIGVTPNGQPYFAMKRVKGTTLKEVIDGVAKDDPELAPRYPQRALLGIVERVAETIAYAHARGVVHRDLKPANVMLGDFGEVSVLDWGIAKLHGDSDLSDASTDAPEFTVPGQIVGTPGYMSPEQATGDPADVRADVYALGAMLFEVITLSRLHPGEGSDRLRSTVRGVDARPSAHGVDCPAELDAICERATKTLRAERYPDAGALLEDLRAFLDGARATELRREVAGKHAEAARLSLLNASTSSETVRVQALRELGAAAVLDPENREMGPLIESLLRDPSTKVPAEVEAELEAHRTKAASHASMRAAAAYAAAMLAMPILAWMGVQSGVSFGILTGALALSGAAALVVGLTGRATSRTMIWSVPFTLATVGLTASLFGPFFLTPAFAGIMAVAYTVSQRADMVMRGVVNACAGLAVLVPLVLTFVGILPPSYRFVDGTLQLLPGLVAYPEVPTTVLLVFCAFFIALVPNVLVGRAIEALRQAERRQFLQNHRLRAMLPQRS